MMGSMNIRDWTWTCKPEHSIFLSFISTNMCLFFLHKKPSLTCPACFIKDWLLLHSCVPVNALLWRGRRAEQGICSLSWPREHLWGLVIKAESRSVVPGLSTGLGGVYSFQSLIHPEKAQHYLTNLVSEKSDNLIALYDLGSDIFWGLVKINLDTCYKADALKWRVSRGLLSIWGHDPPCGLARVTKCRGRTRGCCCCFSLWQPECLTPPRRAPSATIDTDNWIAVVGVAKTAFLRAF